MGAVLCGRREESRVKPIRVLSAPDLQKLEHTWNGSNSKQRPHSAEVEMQGKLQKVAPPKKRGCQKVSTCRRASIYADAMRNLWSDL